MSRSADLRQRFFDAQRDYEEIELPDGQVCYMKGLSVRDVQDIEEAKGPDDDIDLTVIFTKVFGSVYAERGGDPLFTDQEIQQDLLEIPHNHPLPELLIAEFNRINGFELEIDDDGASDGAQRERRRRKKK